MFLGLAGRKGTQLMRGVLFEAALRVAVEVAPAEVTAEAIAAVAAVVVAVAADTEEIVAQVGMGLPEMVLVVGPLATCLVVGVFDIVDQKVNTDSGGAGPQLVDWAMEWAACNK